MKFLIVVIFIFFNLTSFAYPNNIVYIDMNYILSNSDHGKSILIELENINKKNIKELESKEKILKDLETKITNQKNILSKEDLEKKINDLKNKIVVFNRDKDKLSGEFNKLKNNKISDFMKNVEPLVSNYIKENSINIVLDKKIVIIGKKDHDITLEILEIVNKNIK
jgi:outer membrane protein